MSKPPKKTPVAGEAEHIRRMATDRDYAATFLKNSAAEGTEFTVVFKCRDSMQTQALFHAARTRLALMQEAEKAGKELDPAKIPLLMGCEVVGVSSQNVLVSHIQLKQTLASLAAQ